jgi:multidrug transporter EmrE-like cation transporter
MTYVIMSVVLNAFAQLAMKLASQRDLSIKNLLGNVPLIFAGFLYLVSILFWLKGLSGIQLSRAYPYQSLGYILVFGLSYFILNERFLPMQIAGLLVICLGIAILGLAK